MLRFIIGAVLVLHGLVHIWYIVLAQRVISFEPEMGWSGESWLFTRLIGDNPTRNLATALLLLVTIGFAVGGIAFMVQQEWSRTVLIASAALSTAILTLFWDGRVQYVVEKGLIALLINAAVIVGFLVWPPPSQ